jgi:hypothetical protein
MADVRNITSGNWAALVPPIFAECVDPEAARWCSSAPFLQDGFLYATNGHLAVRMPWPGEWAHQAEGRVPKELHLTFHDLRCRAEPSPLPQVVGDCLECGGSGDLPERPCTECDGQGEGDDPDCDCPHCPGSHTCEECDGRGKFGPGPCDGCAGTGLLDAKRSVEVAPGYYLARRYVALLNRYGAMAYLPEEADHARPVRFVAGDVEGVLMMMTGQDWEDDE